jgi:hypothetical protein
MSKYSKLFFFVLSGIALVSFTSVIQESIKIIRYTKTNSGYLVIEYTDGVIKKQVKRNQIMTYNLPFADKNEIEAEIAKIKTHDIIREIDSSNYQLASTDIANMYLFIQGNDTLKNKILSQG